MRPSILLAHFAAFGATCIAAYSAPSSKIRRTCTFTEKACKVSLPNSSRKQSAPARHSMSKLWNNQHSVGGGEIMSRLRHGVMDDLRVVNMNNHGGNIATATPALRQSKTLLAGNLLVWIRRLFCGSKESYLRGLVEMRKAFEWEDVGMIAALVYASVPVCRFLYNVLVSKWRKEKPFEKSKVSKVATLCSQIGRIASYVYLLELVTEFLDGLLNHHLSIARAGIDITESFFSAVPGFVATVIYSSWAARKFSVWKRKAITDYMSNEMNFSIGSRFRDRQTLIPIYDRTFSTLIYGALVVFLLELSNIEVQGLVRSIVALGGVSSIVVGLALQAPAKQLVSGIMLLLSGKFHSGELISMDGTAGKVENIGWVATTIMGNDDISYKLPNEKLLNTRVLNLSRTPMSRVKLNLNLGLKEMYNVSNITKCIKEEIEESCGPKVITDGTRPFAVYWSDIVKKDITITVECHLKCRPTSLDYTLNKEKILQAVAKGIAKANVAM